MYKTLKQGLSNLWDHCIINSIKLSLVLSALFSKYHWKYFIEKDDRRLKSNSKQNIIGYLIQK